MNPETGKSLGTLEGRRGEILGLAFHPNEPYLVSGLSNGSLEVWDLRNKTSTRAINGYWADTLSVVPSADSSKVLIGYSDGTIHLWDGELAESLAVLTGHPAAVTDLSFDPSGLRAVSGSMDGSVRVWDMESHKTIRVLTGHQAPVLQAKFAPDGISALSASGDGTVRIWDVKTGRQLRVLDNGRPRRADIATISESGTGLQLYLPTGHIPTVMALSPDGRFALVGSSLSTGFLWLWPLFDSTTPSQPPIVRPNNATDPYIEFMPLYSSLGLRVKQEGADAGQLELVP